MTVQMSLCLQASAVLSSLIKGLLTHVKVASSYDPKHYSFGTQSVDTIEDRCSRMWQQAEIRFLNRFGGAGPEWQPVPISHLHPLLHVPVLLGSGVRAARLHLQRTGPAHQCGVRNHTCHW